MLVRTRIAGLLISMSIGCATAATPSSSTAPSEARGSLAPDVIRSVVRSHVADIEACYESGLADDPTLSGRVHTKFVISPTGKVMKATVTASDLKHRPTEDCIARAQRTWVFPPPESGGVVVVNYPFMLNRPPSGTSETQSQP